MHRRVPLLIAVVFVAIATWGIASAADCSVSTCVYLPIVLAPPTPIPTPIPAPIQTLTIQLSEMRSGYTLDASQAISNADAAKSYTDPAAALAAFQQQGRETSWFVRYLSTDYLFSDAAGVSNQVYRYQTPDGASAGMAYSVTRATQDHPDYRLFNVSAPCCPIVGLRRTFTIGKSSYDMFYVVMRTGRYVADVQVIGLTGFITVDRALYYAQLALNHIYATPQTTATTIML
jgi:hypothetical protein